MQDLWNHSSHDEHCTMVSPLSGSLQMQKTGTISVGKMLVLVVLRVPDRCGKADIVPLLIHCKRCLHICCWSYAIFTGSFPWQREVVNASANSPQLLLPLCHCTLVCVIAIDFSCVIKRSAISFFVHKEIFICRLSYTFTVEAGHPIVDIVTQWHSPMFKICTNSSACGSIEKIVARTVDWALQCAGIAITADFGRH